MMLNMIHLTKKNRVTKKYIPCVHYGPSDTSDTDSMAR